MCVRERERERENERGKYDELSVRALNNEKVCCWVSIISIMRACVHAWAHTNVRG